MLNESTPFTMPVAPSNGGDFFGGNGWWVIIIFALIFGWGNGGWGGNNSGAADNYVLASDFATLQRQIDSTTSEIKQQGNAIANGICSLGYDQLAQMNGINQNISNVGYNLQNAITTNGYETRSAIQADTVTNMQNTNALQSQLATCCCENRAAIADLNYNLATQSCATQRAIADGTRQVIEYMANKEAQNLRDENFNLKLAASQANQNAFIQNLVRPQINPCYVTQNPYCSCGNAYYYGTTIS